MEYIAANTANQDLYLTLNEARTYLPTYTHYLVSLISQSTGEAFYFVADVIVETDRYTQVQVSTDDDDPTNSAIELLVSDSYYLAIYGQNSSTNLDPLNAAVVGLAHRGFLQVTSADEFFSIIEVSIPDDVRG